MTIKSKIGDCESCANQALEIKAYYGDMYQCEECHSKDMAHQSPEAQEARVIEYRAEEKLRIEAREIDNSIIIKTDLFNASTVSILELKASIDADESVTNKPYALASELMVRFDKFKSLVFDLNQQLAEAGNNQKAIQIYLNNLANTLRAEEREKLKIADINYKPNVASTKVKSISTSGVSKKKATKAEIRAAANELGIPEFTLASFVLMNGGDLTNAVSKLKASIEAAKQAK